MLISNMASGLISMEYFRDYTSRPPPERLAPPSVVLRPPAEGQVGVLPVQGNIYMLVADGTNVAVSVGTEGVAVVNTASAQMSDKLLAAGKLTESPVTSHFPMNFSCVACGLFQ